ncbi:nucleoside hydrolase [Nonomuraea turkmeniaca]|uniref:Nucleoside hydrolase n=1 Tax=Nonomuraea turkmeniaca TaxID=103838 RepID=A0A5S4FM92_9ACTN|nr:nucleoside hydrolase [Nonomuraea turkmeniaca]TMR21846.1 nucleoside hydrolase [Nonomuraea turkmeniaca]
MSSSTVRVILDTDIGTDVDDALALAVLLGSPEVDLLGCTTVYGDTLLRARLAKRLVRLASRSPAVIPGAAKTLTDRPAWWAGHEGRLFTDLDTEEVDSGDAVAYLVDRVSREPGQVDVVAVGPLTNIAHAITASPSFARDVRHLWIMGGRFDDPKPEHNLKCDPEAAAVVFGCGAPITVTGLEITTTVRLDGVDVSSIGGAGALGAVLKAEIEQWWRFWNKEWNCPHDPITVLTMLVPELFGFSPDGRVVVGADGSSTFEEGDGRTRITTSALTEPVAREIVRRIVAAAA